MFRMAADHPLATTWRQHADTCYRYEHGDQWTSDEKTTLKERGQPEIVENEIRPTIERLQGQFRRQKTTIKFMGRNPQDEGTANGASDLLRHIDYVNHTEFVEGEVVKDQLIGGIGWLEVTIARNELGQPQVRYRHEDPFTIFPDPFCRSYDINEEARYLCRAKWIDMEDALGLWGPDKAAKIEQVLGTSHPSLQSLSSIDPNVLTNRNWEINRYYDQQNRRFRPVEIWYKKRATEFVVDLPDGQTAVIRKAHGNSKQNDGHSKAQIDDALLAIPGAKVTERSIDQMWVAVYCGGIFLVEPKPSPYRCNLFPFIPYYCYRKIDGEPQGYVWGLIDPQREINARRSKAIWALNNRQTIYERNAVKDPTELADEMAKMDGQIVLENGKFDKFQVKENQDISQGNLTMLQEAKLAIRRISGEDMMNPAPEVRSGTGIQRLQMVQQAGVLPIWDNIRRSRRMKAKLTFELVKQYYTDEQVFQITDAPGIVRTVSLSRQHMASLKEQIYDLVAVDAADYSTSQAEQFDKVSSTLGTVLQYGPQWAALLIQMSDLRDKELYVKMIQDMSQPPPMQAKPSVAFVWNELTPAERFAIAQQFQWQALAQAILQGGSAEPTSMVQNQAEVVKMKMKTDADVQRAEIAAASAMHQQRVDMHGMAMDHQAKMETAAMKGAIDLKKAEMTAQAKKEKPTSE